MIRATFAGFATALTALQSNSKKLDVTSQNISNMNTEGYTRQNLKVSSLVIRTFSPTTQTLMISRSATVFRSMRYSRSGISSWIFPIVTRTQRSATMTSLQKP